MAVTNCPFRVCYSDFRGYSIESLDDHRVGRAGSKLAKSSTYGLFFFLSFALMDGMVV